MNRKQLIETLSQYITALNNVIIYMPFEIEVIEDLTKYVGILEVLQQNLTLPKEQRQPYPIETLQFEELMDNILALDKSTLLWEAIIETNDLLDKTVVSKFKEVNLLMKQIAGQTFFKRAAEQIIKEQSVSDTIITTAYSQLADALTEYLHKQSRQAYWRPSEYSLESEDKSIDYSTLMQIFSDMAQDIKTTGHLAPTYNNIPLIEFKEIFEQWTNDIDEIVNIGVGAVAQEALQEQFDLLVKIENLLIMVNPDTDPQIVQALKEQYDMQIGG